MSKTQAGTKRRRKLLPWAIFGLLIGAGMAFTMVRWQKKSMPWTTIDRREGDFSIYEVDGDVTSDWPVAGGGVGDSVFDGADSGGETGLEM